MTRRTVLSTSGAVVVVLALGGCSGSSSSAAPPTHTSQPTSKPSPSSSGTKSRTTAPQPTGASPQQSPPATEFRPPGDIPDTQVYVVYRVPGSAVRIKVPEGWARSSANGTTTFTDKYNSIAIAVRKATAPPTVASVKRVDVAQLRASSPKFAPGTVGSVQRQHGTAIRITYFLDSAPSPVTGKVVRDAAERYLFWHKGQEAILTLTGPKTADNVDPWRLVSDSLQWR